MLKSLAVISALALGSVAIAHADTIAAGSYLIQAGGEDQFTTNTITFTPDTAVIANPIGGTFSNYLTAGNAVTFISGTNPYTQGTNEPAPGGSLLLFSVTGTKSGSETFNFYITSYDATYSAGGGIAGCASGDTCLLVTGNGY